MNRSLAGFMILLVTGMGLSCGGGATMADENLQGKPEAESKLFDNAGTYSGVRTARQFVVRDSLTFAALWKEHLAGRELATPGIDFKKHDVVAVFAGSKSTGGYSLKIDSITRTRTGAEVASTLIKPAPGSIVTQAFTYPYAMKAVPKLPAKVVFKLVERASE